MNYFGRLWSGFRAYYQEINPATLTGGIDVIVVEQPDGSYVCSPFHVRFGKLGLLRAKEKVVDISINDEMVPGVHMKLGDSGEAFFVEDVPDDEPEVPVHLCTSPLPTDEEMRMKKGLADLRQLHRDMRRSEGQGPGPASTLADSPDRLGDREAAAASLFRTAISNPDLSTFVSAEESQDEADAGSQEQSAAAAVGRKSPTMAEIEQELIKPSVRVFLSSDQEESGPCFDSCDEHQTNEKAIPKRKRMRHKMREIPVERRRNNQQRSSAVPRKTFSWHSGLAAMSLIPGADVSKPPPLSLPSTKQQTGVTRDSNSSTGTDGVPESGPGRGPAASGGQKANKSSKDDIFQFDVTDEEEAEEDQTTPTVERWGPASWAPDGGLLPLKHHLDRVAQARRNADTPPAYDYSLSTSLPAGILYQRRSLPACATSTSAAVMPEGYAGNTTPEGRTTVIFSMTEDKGVGRPMVPGVEYAYSDMELTPTAGRKVVQAKSDTDLTRDWEGDQATEGEWNWGELPSPSKESKVVTQVSEEPKGEDKLDSSGGWGLTSWFMGRPKKEPEEGIYLDDLVKDPEKAAKYLSSSLEERNRHLTGESMQRLAAEAAAADKSDDSDASTGKRGGGSGAGSSSAEGSPLLASGVARRGGRERDPQGAVPQGAAGPPSAPSTEDGGYVSEPSSIAGDYTSRSTNDLLSDIALSLCGSLETPVGEVPQEVFDQHLVSFQQLNAQPNLISSHDLVIKVGNRFYNWKVAAPMLVSLLVFQQPLTEAAIQALVDQHTEPSASGASKEALDVPASGGGYSSWFSWKRGGSEEPPLAAKEAVSTDSRSKTPVPTTTVPTSTGSVPTDAYYKQSASSPFLFGADDSIFYASSDTESEVGGVKRYRKTLRLSSDQLKGLNLKPGQNKARFSVTTKYQGTTWCTCDIYLWRWDDSLVISDIDGTITKSDVMGQIAPYVGGMWAQPGVTRLFTRIYNNGYRILYLSARAIGQSYATKEYLRSVRLCGMSLPDGPVFLSPASLLQAFHREVIEKKPEEFKKACLNDLRSLFPACRNPLYAGFGNKINDTWAYRALGIPPSRIFSINHLGELRHEFSTGFSSSYESLAVDMVDHVFPPVHSEDETAERRVSSRFTAPDQFSAFTYWKPSYVEILMENEE